MIGRCIIKLPFYKGGLIKIKTTKKIGFSFTRQMMYEMMQLHEEFNQSFEKYSEYAKSNYQSFAIEMYYCAALAWCKENYKKPTFTQKSFFEAIAACKDKTVFETLHKTWNESDYGAKDLPGKKKAELITP